MEMHLVSLITLLDALAASIFVALATSFYHQRVNDNEVDSLILRDLKGSP